MKAMILAAGLGTRMRPLTLTIPKPLVPLLGKPLIEYPLRQLKAVGIRHIMVNHAWLGQQIVDHLTQMDTDGVQISFSKEDEPLETGGGIFKVLPWLTQEGEPFFLVMNADVYSDVDLSVLLKVPLDEKDLGCLVMIENPDWHPTGDFRLGDTGYLSESDGQPLTFSGISILSPKLFSGCEAGAFALAPLLRRAISQGRLKGVFHQGIWSDVGTPERLAALEAQLIHENRE
ncbi:N-acetylmuramate alpha-1-phosphate uridylyltransferase MurU [Nitrincola nitratireducens]|uniref:Glucose-1-phosphate thymidylyltransferase n=1 Tax=Nitrincola nitratireducens TaxID=1229521 RepID=W9UZM2_9GAMM|nr:nucleotidyltransferase family protein [Nitrincola nitratireducens]EXJ12698.1 Glucose-1-phosphate thymidylyltransferase [Nitrincola nitratireducens]